MIDKITDFFKQLNTPFQQDNSAAPSLEIACTVLLYEVMKADGALQESERLSLKNIISKHFNLKAAEINDIVKEAVRLSEDATDFYQFTTKINEHYPVEQKMKMLSYLWQLAYADGELASIEEHIIRKISDLLGLRHSEYIQTKLANTPSS